jgi:hypothetical protein
MKKLLLAFASLTVGLTANAQTLIADFQFNGDVIDAQGNAVCMPFNDSVFAFNSGVASWAANSNMFGGGLMVSLPDLLFTEDNYSILMEISLFETDGYRKLIDFSLLTEDYGFYVNDQLRLYNSGNYGATMLNADSVFTVLITRNALDDSTKTYLWDGTMLLEESIALDATQDFVAGLNGANREMYFFADDSLTSSEFAASGTVNYIRIYNGIVSTADITASVEESKWKTFLTYPNPANEFVTIDFGKPIDENLEIYDISGKLIQTIAVNGSNQVQVSISTFEQGIYIARTTNGSVRFVKQ